MPWLICQLLTVSEDDPMSSETLQLRDPPPAYNDATGAFSYVVGKLSEVKPVTLQL
jgi:hypothetical protein